MISAPLQVFFQFFVLGLTSFGGPVAHLGYFHERFVQQLSGFLRAGALVFGGGLGAPVAGTSLGAQRLDRPAAVSGGVWRSPGGARADVQFRGLSWL